MPLTTIEQSLTVPSFASVKDLQVGLSTKGQYVSGTLYPRDGTELLSDTEALISKFARVNPGEALLLTSGMAAVTLAIELALSKDQSSYKSIACPAHLYNQTSEYLEQYVKSRGVELVHFRPGSPASVEAVIKKHRPGAIIVETIGNEPEAPVVDIDRLLKTVGSASPDSVVILDNTLPLSTGLPLGPQLRPEDRIIVVESGTKAYTANTELSGVLYSKNPELLREARALRRAAGTMPGLGSIRRIRSLLPKTVASFDNRNKRLFRAAAELAAWLKKAEEEGANFTVWHPSLANHPNHRLATQRHADSVSPILYVSCKEGIDKFELTERFWNHPVVREHADLGQSFGFDRTRILPNSQFAAIRIAAGAFTDTDALGRALYEASLS